MISVIMPAYNEGARIAESLRESTRALEGSDYEVVVVDDGSTDGTFGAARDLARVNPRIKVVRIETNRGKGHAIRVGFSQTRGDVIVFLDADLDIPPSEIWTLCGVMERAGVDVVVGSKRHPQSEISASWVRRLVSRIYSRIVDILFQLPVRDTQTGIKLFRRHVLERVFPRTRIDRFGHDLELLVAVHRSGYRIAEAPVVLSIRHTRMPLARASFQVWLDTLRIYYWASFWDWLRPGWTTKLWMILLVLGIVGASFGLAGILSHATIPGPLRRPFHYLTLQFLGKTARNWVLLASGSALVIVSVVHLNRQLMNAFARRDEGDLAGIMRARGSEALVLRGHDEARKGLDFPIRPETVEPPVA
jgi:glycosyltransferase involved in cell wall biosynthesis